MTFKDSKEHTGSAHWHCQEPDANEHRRDDEYVHTPTITTSLLRSDRRLEHLLPLRKGIREHVLDPSLGERQQLYLLRKAEEKARKLARKNRRLSILHEKGERRKTQRQGVGKCSWSVLQKEDIHAAREHAHISTSSQLASMNWKGDLDGVQQEGWLPDSACEWIDTGPCLPEDLALILDQLDQNKASRWEEGLEMAAVALKLYLEVAKSRGDFGLPSDYQELVHLLEKNGGAFEKFQARFLKAHGKNLREALDWSLEHSSLTPAPLSSLIKQRFLAACGSSPMRKIVPGFHGTPASNHSSIFDQGLLIPGQANDIRVAHGSAHGNGVYVAKLGNPWLSLGFAGGACKKMLVCGVMDDSVALSRPQMLGCLSMTKESSSVRHVGDAMVVFESSCVAPLFVAEWHSTRLRTAQHQPQQSQGRNKNNYHKPNYRYHYHRYNSYFYPRTTWAWSLVKHKSATWFRKEAAQDLINWLRCNERAIYDGIFKPSRSAPSHSSRRIGRQR